MASSLGKYLSGRIRPAPPRDANEAHRAATPLELFFDLVSVIAIASAAAGLHHAIAENHILEGIVAFAMAFFAIWWAWMNFTWYASAYDNDDALYRVLTIIIMGGALCMAAGIHGLQNASDLTLVVVGYVIMRIAMIGHWLRAARHDPERRAAALTYAGGIALAQVYWVIFYFLQPLTPALFYASFLVGVVAELAVPVIAERKSPSPWHRHHIIERYGLLNIIVLGETLLAGVIALRGTTGDDFNIVLVHIAISALVIVFSMWWLYFAREEHIEERALHRAIPWGYGHIVIFASGAAVGAGFAVLVDIVSGRAEVPLIVGDYAVAIPVAIYMLGLWFVRDRFAFDTVAQYMLPLFAVLVLVVAATPLALEGIAIVCVLAVIARNYCASRENIPS